MKLAAQLAAALQRFDRRVWPAHRAALTPALAKLLTASKLVVADVGAAAGPEERWQSLPGLVHFLTFDPVPRATSTFLAGAQTNFPVALSSRSGRGLLSVTRDPDASTLYPVNRSQVDRFPIGEGLQVVGSEKLELSTFDECLAPTPHLAPDFIKVDVEGADLDVLRGAATSLQNTVVGVRVEVSFLERHQGAPFFGETDAFLREHGFELFQLSREQWIRRNLVHGYSSRPQLAWGDAVYFLSLDSLMERLKPLPQAEREARVAKFVVILLAHGVHDYAVELAERAAAAGQISAAWSAELKSAVLDSVDGSVLYVLKSSAGVVFAAAIYLLACPLKSTRQRARFYVQQRAGHFGRMLARMAGRSGPQQSCISD